MGKLLRKLMHGILPPCLFASFLRPARASSRTLPYSKLRQNNHKPAPGLSDPQSPSLSSSPRSADHVPAYLMEIEQSTHYYSYSEDDQENLSIAGARGETSPLSVGSGSSDNDANNSHYYILKEFEHGIHNPHHHHSHLCQKHEDIGYHDDAPMQYRKPCLEGCKRKSLVFDEDDDQSDRSVDGDKDNNKPKRQKRASVSCQLPKCISEVVGRGSAIVQYSYHEPHHAFWESMVDMIVSNGLWDASRQESLLLCYLTLNDPHLYTTICTSFLQALKDLHA